MNSGQATVAQEVTEDSQLDEDPIQAGKEFKEQIDGAYATPVAEHFPIRTESLSATAAHVGGSHDTILSTKALSTQVEDVTATNNSRKTPLVPPRHRKRRVAELKCCEVRWFHRKSGTETKWTPFKG